MKKKSALDPYEKDIENNFEQHQSLGDKSTIKRLQSAALAQLKDKKPITLRVSLNDIQAIKIKASKIGVPYQTYINMLIHKDATSL